MNFMAKMFLKNRILTHKIESILGQIEIFGTKIIGYFLKLPSNFGAKIQIQKVYQS